MYFTSSLRMMHGTEPKIKFYAGIKGTSLEDSAKKLDELMEAIRNA